MLASLYETQWRTSMKHIGEPLRNIANLYETWQTFMKYIMELVDKLKHNEKKKNHIGKILLL